MIIGTVTEIKNHEYRVGMIPSAAREYITHGHQVVVQSGAGLGCGMSDDLYRAAGAEILPSAEEVFARADMIVKVKEPLPQEVALLKPGQILYTYLHLAADRQLTERLCQSRAICVAYETVKKDNTLPLLSPMSEVAGRMSVQVGARCLEKENSGKGVLLGGVPGVLPAKVVVLGGGVAGMNAARIAIGMGACVTIIDRSVPRLAYLDQLFGTDVHTLYATADNIEMACISADLVIGAVLVPGAVAPKLLTRDILKKMSDGSVLVDISIDQGGCFETSRPTSHAEPTYIEEGVVHYCVTNMPGAVANTSAQALNNVTLHYGLKIADQGWKEAMRACTALQEGLNVADGHVIYPAVATSLGMPCVPVKTILS